MHVGSPQLPRVIARREPEPDFGERPFSDAAEQQVPESSYAYDTHNQEVRAPHSRRSLEGREAGHVGDHLINSPARGRKCLHGPRQILFAPQHAALH